MITVCSSQGDCYEYVNFWIRSTRWPRESDAFFRLTLSCASREDGNNRRLLETVDTVKPDVCFFVLLRMRLRMRQSNASHAAATCDGELVHETSLAL